MREIKFRAWDKSYRVLHYAVDMFTLEEPMAAYELGEKSRYIFMQFTELKDKNGKEIYEGDIVQSIGWDIRWQVTFEDGAFSIHDYPEEVEVIGNIYENPRLLEAKNEQPI